MSHSRPLAIRPLMMLVLMASLFSSAASADSRRSSGRQDQQSALVTTSAMFKETKWNFRLNALQIFFGIFGAELDRAVNRSWTLGPTFSYVTASWVIAEVKAFSFGMRGHYYLSHRRFKDGWYVAPHLFYMPLNATANRGGVEYKGTSPDIGATMMLGRQWFWGTGLNMSIGAGVSYFSAGDSITLKSPAGGEIVEEVKSFHKIAPALEFSLGYLF